MAGPTSLSEFANQILFTAKGHYLIVVGNAVGLIFAILVLEISVVSFPLLLDRKRGCARCHADVHARRPAQSTGAGRVGPHCCVLPRSGLSDRTRRPRHCHSHPGPCDVAPLSQGRWNRTRIRGRNINLGPMPFTTPPSFPPPCSFHRAGNVPTRERIGRSSPSAICPRTAGRFDGASRGRLDISSDERSWCGGSMGRACYT